MPIDQVPSQELITRAVGGDPVAFEALIYRHRQELRLYVAARLHGAELVDETLQETFVRAFEHLDRYRPTHPPIAWLKGIARNCIREQLRQLTRSKRLQAVEGGIEALVAEEQLDRMDKRLRTPDEERLRTCLERLPARARTLLQRRYGEDVPLNKLAQAFKKSAGALASELQRLRRALAKCLQRQRVEP